ncbi:hypothetical protein WJX72_000551 [[Myrmecia] bisecta]|uniref:Glycosyltransferase n=1 Tax=[Myrmecia] bisecta TaxID=41462 RepID=A0AAW1PED8_9CHLO
MFARLRRNKQKGNKGRDPVRIPRILHQIFLDGLEELERESARPGTKFPKEWRLSCLQVHQHWEYHFWDLEAAEDLLRERYPWFLRTFQRYPNTVMKGDALRPFILHAYGGMYLDMDVSCYRATDQMIASHDLVLQSEYDGGHDINNAIMASVPGHPFWQKVAAIMTHTAEELNFDKMDARMILDGTGPGIMRLAFKIYAYDVAMWEDSYVGSWVVDGSRMRVWGLGTCWTKEFDMGGNKKQPEGKAATSHQLLFGVMALGSAAVFIVSSALRTRVVDTFTSCFRQN